MPSSIDLYQYHHRIASAITERAVKGHCVKLWYLAADRWDITMKHNTTLSAFRIKLEESWFVGQFNLWLKQHPRLKEKHAAYLKSKKNESAKT